MLRMNPLLHPNSVILGVATALSAVFAPGPLKLPLTLLLGVLWIGAVALTAAKSVQRREGQVHPSEISPESRLYLRPLEGLRDELREIVRDNQDMPSVKIVGQEAVDQADQIVEHARKLIALREQLKRTLRGRSEAEVAIRQLEKKQEAAVTDGERASIQTAIDAHASEVAHYGEVEEAIRKIDAKVTQAQASLSELKARIAVGAAGARTDGVDQEALNDMVIRLKSLTASFDEAESLLREHVR